MLESAAILYFVILGVLLLLLSIKLSRSDDVDAIGCAIQIVVSTLVPISFGIAFAIYFIG